MFDATGRGRHLIALTADETEDAPYFLFDAGHGFVFVQHIAVVQPSGFLPLPVGSVRVRSIVDLHDGSRSRSYAATGSSLGDRPACLLTVERTA